jgi:hypothetical protein
MTKVHFDISMSLDGFITGPGESVEKPLGDDAGRLHDWMFDAPRSCGSTLRRVCWTRCRFI